MNHTVRYSYERGEQSRDLDLAGGFVLWLPSSLTDCLGITSSGSVQVQAIEDMLR